MPARARGASSEQLAAWAQQGISRVGIEYVQLAAKVTHHIDYAERGTGTATPQEVAILRSVWPSTRRLETAIDGAYDLRKHLEAGAGPEAESAVSGAAAQYSAKAAIAELDHGELGQLGTVDSAPEASTAEADAAEVEVEAGS
jgi:hypothetical protein